MVEHSAVNGFIGENDGEVGRTGINRKTVPGIAETGTAGIGKTGLLGVL